MDPIVVTNLGKQFRRQDPNRPQTLIEAISRGFRGLSHRQDQFWALQDVSFTVPSGQMVGVIGHNGAGKSTLLRLVGSVGQPTRGHVQVNGRIGALLDLGTGFHPELTGRENVFVAGVIGGLTRQQVADRFDEIVAFAELGAFIDHPLRTYSSGMQMRLAFAVASHIDPHVLLIDEVLAVGDIAFQRKCMDRIARFKENGAAILLVTHDTDVVERLCDAALWLRNGRVAAQGHPHNVVRQYVTAMAGETRRRTPTQPHSGAVSANGTGLVLNENRFGSQEMQITDLTLLSPTGQPTTTINARAGGTVIINYLAPEPIDSPIFSLTISTKEGDLCFDTNTVLAGMEMPTVTGRGQLRLVIDRLDLRGGEYFLDVGVHKADWSYAYDYHWHVYPLRVHSGGGDKGLLWPPHKWELRVDDPVQAK